MKTLNEIFPLKGIVTQEILDKANIADQHNCIGALTLQAALDNADVEASASWGAYNSWATYIDGKPNSGITTVGEINMMHIKEPMEVTFILV